jgi:hypothetical protein
MIMDFHHGSPRPDPDGACLRDLVRGKGDDRVVQLDDSQTKAHHDGRDRSDLTDPVYLQHVFY